MTSIATARRALATLLPALALWACGSAFSIGLQDTKAEEPVTEEEKEVQVQYLEIVTPKVKETCATLATLHGVEFGEPVPALGNARTAALEGGGRIAVRAPMRKDEAPVVRPYLLVDDIEAASKAAKAAGAEIAIPPMELPGEGTFAIYILGGVEYGLWKN